MIPISQPPSMASLGPELVRLQISSDTVEQIFEFLVHSHIPFELHHLAHSVEAPVRNSFSADLLSPERLEEANDPMEAVYQTYIMKATAAPREQEMAQWVGMNCTEFKTRFRTHYGKTVYQAYMACKMERAGEWLQQGYRCVEVSRRLGYSETSSIKFNKMFQKHFGMTPKKYQLMHQNRS